jgi:Mor family transcriptional regulator
MSKNIKSNTQIIPKKDLEELHKIDVVKEIKIKNADKFNNSVNLVEIVTKLILEGHKPKEIPEIIKEPIGKVRYIINKYALLKLRDKEYHKQYPKIKESFEKAVKTNNYKIIKQKLDNLDPRSLHRLKKLYQINLFDIRLQNIKDELLKTRSFLKTARKLNIYDNLNANDCKTRFQREFYQNNKEWCEQNGFNINIRTRTDENETKDRNKIIYEEYINKKLTPKELANKYNLSVKHVYVILSDLKINKNKRVIPLKKEIIERNENILKDHKKGMNKNDLANKYGLNYNYIGKIIKYAK